MVGYRSTRPVCNESPLTSPGKPRLGGLLSKSVSDRAFMGCWAGLLIDRAPSVSSDGTLLRGATQWPFCGSLRPRIPPPPPRSGGSRSSPRHTDQAGLPLTSTVKALVGCSCRLEVAAISLRPQYGPRAPGPYFYSSGVIRPFIRQSLCVRRKDHVRPVPISILEARVGRSCRRGAAAISLRPPYGPCAPGPMSDVHTR